MYSNLGIPDLLLDVRPSGVVVRLSDCARARSSSGSM
eukprot:SAG31_NODE_20172_length_581_cov_32.495851_1_plen_36_part_01